jgi:hypothetical protein
MIDVDRAAYASNHVDVELFRPDIIILMDVRKTADERILVFYWNSKKKQCFSTWEYSDSKLINSIYIHRIPHPLLLSLLQSD